MTAAAMPARMPVSVITSLAMHGAVFGLWLYTVEQTNKRRLTVINDVNFIQVKKQMPFPKPAVKVKPNPSTFDFLKMALPAAPKLSPRALNVPLPEARKPMQVAAPKLKDRGRLDMGPKLDMDLEKNRSLDIAKVDARIPTRKLAALAAMPRLEEVGRRRVANLPAAIAMEERRQEAMALKADEALARATQRRSAAAMPQGLQEAAQPVAGSGSSRFNQKIASLLPEAVEMRPAVMQTHRIKETVARPEVSRRPTSALQEEEKKGVEIEGPLADRKVLAYDIPEFPKWAKEQGVLEANVAIRFWVNKEGDVLANMRVEHTSGYGRLDKLALESLARWKFAPLIGEERQWGVITFRFLLE